jgi:transcriptional regulator with XRE-family HTH domain
MIDVTSDDHRDRFLEALGQAVRRRRGDLQLSQQEAAERSGLHRNYIGGIERGERNPSIVNVAALASGLDLNLSELARRVEAEVRLREEIGPSPDADE